MKVSIIVPSYNAEETIERCVDSILNQTIDLFEVIVVDDGSTDGTAEVCKKYISDPRFHYIKKGNGGPASARNVGLDMACGEYVGFVDADDQVAREMYENMYNSCVKNYAEMGVCDIERFKNGVSIKKDTDSRRGGVFNREQIKTEILPFCLGYIGKNGRIDNFDWSVLRHIFSRSLLVENNIRFDETLKNSEDCLFVYKSICNANNIVYLKGYYYYYNIIGDSLTRRYSSDYWKQRNHLIDEILTISSEFIENFNIRNVDCFILRCAYASAGNIALGFALKSGFKSFLEYRNIMYDYRVQAAANHINPSIMGFDWQRFLVWLQRRQCVRMYFYYKDVYGNSKLHHLVRKIVKRLKSFTMKN